MKPGARARPVAMDLAVGGGGAEVADRHDAFAGDGEVAAVSAAPVPSKMVASRMIRSWREGMLRVPCRRRDL